MRKRRDPYEEEQGTGVAVWVARATALFAAVTVCFVAALLLFGRWQSARLGGAIAVDGGDPALNPIERLYLQGYLASRAEALSVSAGSTSGPVTFVIAPGETAREIAANLAESALITDQALFRNYLRYYGLDSNLEAGTYQLSVGLTIPELATTLSRAVAQDVVVRFIEGWRIGEIVDYLAQTQPANIDAAEFESIVQRQVMLDTGDYSFLASLPAEATLEGFLFPDTYRIPLEADAEHLVKTMLDNFDRRVTPAIRQSYGLQGLSVYEAVTLASIIQREAVVSSELPLMAGVFMNRIGQNMRLEADPTVQYALGFQTESGKWWKSPLLRSDLEVNSPYNTYLHSGLPPGPIASPGLAALEAVAKPEESGFLFFVADCEAEITGSHAFSLTFEEHLANVQRCR